jgi:transcriptional regulator with GAF, ATPase, and Fis domain
VSKVAPTDSTVLLTGETGTGKELIARAIHYRSVRADRPLITLDCAAIPEGLMESHLFGHVKGAFTGAIENREGVFWLANMGTLFIDEIGELGLPLQAKLLRVIQSREFFKVGGTRPILTDIRLITATNRDLRAAVEKGMFREDLFYRVAVITIEVPPLRERKEDIPLLVEHIVKKFAMTYRKRIVGVTEAALGHIVAHQWRGNVRQLENSLEQAVVLTEADVLTEEDIFVDGHPFLPEAGPRADEPESRSTESWPSLRELTRHHIFRTLLMVKGNRTAAARLLGISTRGLQYKLHAYAAASGPPLERIAGDTASSTHPLLPFNSLGRSQDTDAVSQGA